MALQFKSTTTGSSKTNTPRSGGVQFKSNVPKTYQQPSEVVAPQPKQETQLWNGMQIPEWVGTKNLIAYNPTTKILTFKFPDKLGGGTYSLDENKNVARTERDYGGVEPVKGSQRDHIVPVALGGGSTADNIKVKKVNPVATEMEIINAVKDGEISPKAAIPEVLRKKYDLENKQSKPALEVLADSITEQKPVKVLTALFKKAKEVTAPLREKIGNIIDEVNPFGVTPAYAPADEENLTKLQEDYNNSLQGKYNAKVNLATNEFVSGLTGGIIKPPTEAPKTITDKVIAGIANVAGTVTAINKISKVFGTLAEGSSTVVNLLNKYPKVSKYAYPLLKNIVGFDVYGQLDPDTKDRFKKLATDTLMAVPYTGLGFIPKAGYSIPASFGLGFGLAKMNGASDEDAIIQGGILGVLDAVGRMGGQGTHFVKGRIADRYIRAEAVDTINQYSEVKITAKSSAEEIKQAYRSAARKTHPDLNPTMPDTNFKGVNEAYKYLTGETNQFTGVKVKETAPEKTQEIKRIGTEVEIAPVKETATIETKPVVATEVVPSSELRTQYEKLSKQITALQGENAPDLMQKLLDTKKELSIYNDINQENVFSIKRAGTPTNYADINVVQMSDGKWAYSYNADATNNSISSDYLTNDLVKTRAEAISSAKKEIISWAEKQIVGTDGNQKIELQTIIDETKKVNPELGVPTEVRTAEYEKALDESDTEIPTTKLSSLMGAEVEMPVAKAVDATIKENSMSSGFHTALNQRWTIVYKNPSKKLISAAEQAGLEVSTRETPKGSGQILTDVSLPNIGVKDQAHATRVFNDFADIYSGEKKPKTQKEKVAETKTETGLSKELENKISELRKLAIAETETEAPERKRGQLKPDETTFDKELKIVNRQFGKEIYSAYKSKYGEYPIGFISLSDSPFEWKNEKEGSILFDVAQAETDQVETQVAENLDDVLTTLRELKSRGRSSEIIQSDIQYEVERTRPTEKSPAGETRKSKRIGLMDYSPTYTPRMNQLIKEAQDNGDLFPYTKMTPEEQKIVDNALRDALEEMPTGKNKIDEFTGKEIQQVAVADIIPEERGKVKQETIDQVLADKEIKRPVLLRKQGDKYLIVDGANRVEGARQLGLKEVPAVLETTEPIKELSAKEQQQVKNLLAGADHTNNPDVENIIQFHGTQQGEALRKAISSGEVKPTDGLIGKGFYVTVDKELAEYFGKQLNQGTYRISTKNPVEIIPIDLRDLNIKTQPFGKGEYYEFLKEEKLTTEQYNEKLKAEGYDGLNLMGRGETVIWNVEKIKEYPVIDELTIKPTEPTKKQPRFAKTTKTNVKVKQNDAEIAKKVIGVRKPNLPILGEFKVEKGIMSATDLEIGLRLKTGLTDGMYKVVGKEAVKTNTDPKDFPIIPEVNGTPVFQVLSDNIKPALKNALKSIDKNSIRPEISGISITTENKGMVIKATDAYRLYRKTVYGKILNNDSFVLGSVEKLEKIIDTIGEKIEGTNDAKDTTFKFSGNNGEIVLRSIEGKFPDTKNIYPAYKNQYSFDKKEILDAIKEIKPFVKQQSTSSFNSVEIKHKDGKLTITTAGEIEGHKKSVSVNSRKQQVKISEGIEADGVIVMPVMQGEVGGTGSFINVNYMEDAINSLDDEAVFLYQPENPQNTPSFFTNLTEKEIAEIKPAIEKSKWQGGGSSGKGQGNLAMFAEGMPVLEGSINRIRPIQAPEMVEFVKQLTGNVPIINKRLRSKLGVFWGRGAGEIQLRPDIFRDPMQVAKTLAHEIGHLADWLPQLGIKRTSLLQKLYILKNHIKTEFGENLVKNQDIKDELWNLSTLWRPLGDNPTEGFLKYRKSGSELYADAISVLFNSPGLLEQKAPIFYKAFFASLDQKPDVNEKYWEIQDLLFGAKEQLFEARENRIKQGFVKAENIQKGFEEKKKKSDKRLVERLRQQLDDKYYPALKKVREAETRGEIINDNDNPKYLFQELAYVNNDNYLLVEKLDREVSQPIKEAGMNDDDIGIALLLERIVNERKDIANPYGFDLNTAQDQLNHLRQRVGEDNFKLLQDKIKLFHEEVFKSVERAVEVGSYNKEVFEKTIKPNKDTYATFAVVDYLQDYVPTGIKKQIGTLKEVANPYHLTILKTAALNKLNAYQGAKNSMRDLLQRYFPTEISKSKELRSGKLSIFKTNREKLMSGQLQMLEDGKLKSYDIDPYIAKSFEIDDPDNLNVAVKLLGKINQSFKSIVTTYNLGFALGFNPPRDWKRTWKNIKSTHGLFKKVFPKRGGILKDEVLAYDLIKAYIQSFGSATRYAKGQLDEVTRQMVADKLITAPMYDYNYDPREDGMGSILEKYGVISRNTPDKDVPSAMKNARKFLLKPLIKLLEGIRFTAQTFEVISKIAGTKVRIKYGETGKELAYNVRNYTGTPNWKVRGTQTATTNEIFIFSNIMKEGLKSDFIIATDPKTRSGWWWKTIKMDLFPKFLQFLASIGAFGMAIKAMYDKMSEYDKTNYINIPLGTRPNGKVVYGRIPHDETARLASSIFWKALNLAKDKDVSGLQDILAVGAGQMPNVTPLITLMEAWGQFATGRNPYDSFRGRTLIDDTTFQAGGFPALKKMVQWSANTFGLSQFTTYDPNKNDTLETTVQILPLINRLVKISDYGLTEQSKEIQGEIKTERAKELLKEKSVINKYVGNNKAEYRAGNVDIETIGDQVVRDVLGHDPETDEDFARDKNIRGKLKTAMVVGAYDAKIDSLVYATSNREKVAILKKYQAELSSDKFNELMNTLYDEGIISNAVYDEVEP